jgi:hypothetical protein
MIPSEVTSALKAFSSAFGGEAAKAADGDKGAQAPAEGTAGALASPGGTAGALAPAEGTAARAADAAPVVTAPVVPAQVAATATASVPTLAVAAPVELPGAADNGAKDSQHDDPGPH